MPLLDHGAHAATLTTTTHADSKITIRPDTGDAEDAGPVILLRLDATWTHTAAATYLDPDEARQLAAALTRAADHPPTNPAG
jgi:hypothetical protein